MSRTTDTEDQRAWDQRNHIAAQLAEYHRRNFAPLLPTPSDPVREFLADAHDEAQQARFA